MKLSRKLHLWLSVPFGLVVTVICLSGAMLALEPLFPSGEGRLPFFRTMFRLHRWLLDPANPRGPELNVGKLIVGISTLLFIVVLVTGTVMWWPRVKAGVAKSLKVVTGRGAGMLWRTLHVAGGMYALLFLLTMALTGLTWSFGWYREGFTALTGLDKAAIYALHTGSWGGGASRTVWFLAALFGASLPLTGYYIWLKRLLRKKRGH